MKSNFKLDNSSRATVFTTLIILALLLVGLGVFAWWAFSWSTHTLVWFIFIFGSLFGSVKVRT